MLSIVDIATNGYYLGISRGKLSIKNSNIPQDDSIAIDNVISIIVSAQQFTVSSALMSRMSEFGVVMIYCNKFYIPVSYTVPIFNNIRSSLYINKQAKLTDCDKKILWKDLLKSKIINSQNNLHFFDIHCCFKKYLKDIDQNKIAIEGVVAHLYFKKMFGNDFLRDQNGSGINALLNYGYTILRSLISRSVCSYGLSPALGIFHCSGLNNFCLVDDLMEPYRVFVDCKVKQLVLNDSVELNNAAKYDLIQVLDMEISMNKKNMKIRNAVEKTVLSYRNYCDNNKEKLDLPVIKEKYLKNRQTQT